MPKRKKRRGGVMSADAQLPEIDKEEDEEENINELYNFLCTAAQSTCEKNTATQ